MDEYEEKDGVRMRRMVRLNLGNYDEKMNENKDVRILDKRMGENKTIEIEVEKKEEGNEDDKNVEIPSLLVLLTEDFLN